MSGVDARDGFWFQDARILVRLLRDAVERRTLLLSGEFVRPAIHIRIEAAAPRRGEEADAAPRPPWDSVTVDGPDLIVDETKLGDVSKEDRLAFYARLRATVAAQGSISGIVPRLTTAKGAQRNEEKWRGLRSESATAPVPSAAPEEASTAGALAQEALFYLTSVQLPSRKNGDKGQLVNAPTRSMSEADARALLGRFIFDDDFDRDATKAELERLLVVLGAEDTSDEVIRHLRGWIADKACVRPEGAEISCETMSAELELVARYLRTDIDAEKLLLRLRRAVPPPEIEPMLSPRPWREVQPSAAASFVPERHRRVVFVGSGGVGKTVTLSQLHRELAASDTCLWIDTSAALELMRLAEAVELGAWTAQRKGKRLVVLLDMLDQQSEPLAWLATIHGVLPGDSNALVITAARLTTWAAISATAQGWLGIELGPWPATEVTRLPFAASLPPDLVDLLRTPLLLDIYLRTLAGADPATFHPTSRHELLAEYFHRQILRAAPAVSGARRGLLEKLGKRVAAGELHWTLEPAEYEIAESLVSEGLLIDVDGQLRFRHALLQDICVAMAIASVDPARCVQALRATASSSLRHDAIRSLLEAAIVIGAHRGLVKVPPVSRLLEALQVAGLPVQDALGDVVVDSGDLPVILDGVGRLATILKWARNAGNRSWLVALANQSTFPRPLWLRADNLTEDLHQIAWDVIYGKLPGALARQLAERLRSWAGQALTTEGWGAAMVISAVLSECPTGDTLEWLDSLPQLPDSEHCDLLSGLRRIAAEQGELDEAMLARMVLRGFDAVGNGRDSPRPRGSGRDGATRSVVMNALHSDGDTRGLIETRPRAAFRVLFELCARHGEARIRERREREQDPAHIEMMEELGRLLAEGEEGLRAVESGEREQDEQPASLNVEGAAEIIDDVPPGGWHPDTDPLHAAWASAAESLDDPVVMKIAQEEAAQSRSRAARNLVAGKDAKIASPAVWVRSDQPFGPTDPLPPGTPAHVGRAWRLLEVIVRARISGVRSTFVAGGTLREIFRSAELLADMPLETLRSLKLVIHDFRESAVPEELIVWADRILRWLEQIRPVAHDRAVEIFECVEECFHGAARQAGALLGRFMPIFAAQYACSSPVQRAELFHAVHGLSRSPDMSRLLKDFARTHPDPDAMRSAWLPIRNARSSEFLDIMQELLVVSPQVVPRDAVIELGVYLGVLSCTPDVPRAWELVGGWLAQRPDSVTCSDPERWRELLIAVGTGAAHNASRNVVRYAEIARALWRAWISAPSKTIHGLVAVLFSSAKTTNAEMRRALLRELAPLAIEVSRSGNGYDLLGIQRLAWPDVPFRQLDLIAESLADRIGAGEPEPDENGAVAFALSELVKDLATSTALSSHQAERLHTVVQPAVWLTRREARCQELQACSRIA